MEIIHKLLIIIYFLVLYKIIESFENWGFIKIGESTLEKNSENSLHEVEMFAKFIVI